MRANEFISEAEVKPYKVKQIRDNDLVSKIYALLEEHCSTTYKQLINKPIWRGMSNSGAALIINPASGKRMSQNTFNYYTELFDHLPSFNGFPKRSRSLICSTSPSTADMFGYAYAIFPFDGAKIGVCPSYDLWRSKVYMPLIGERSMSNFNDVLMELDMPETYSGMINYSKSPQFAENLKRMVQRSYRGEILDQLDPIAWFNELLGNVTPKQLGLSLMTASQLAHENLDADDSGREVWMSSKVIAVDYRTYQQMKAKQKYFIDTQLELSY